MAKGDRKQMCHGMVAQALRIATMAGMLAQLPQHIPVEVPPRPVDLLKTVFGAPRSEEFLTSPLRKQILFGRHLFLLERVLTAILPIKSL